MPFRQVQIRNSYGTVQQFISGLSENTTYYYRLELTNDYGTIEKSILNFTTPACTQAPQNQRPTITLLGSNLVNINVGQAYNDPGATAYDPEDGNITSSIIKSGFVNSSVVKEVESIVENKNNLIKKTENAELLRMYKQHYPLDKIITLSMFEDVCDKYGLIIAPVENYIKDIPEKNLLELKNSKPTINEHFPDDYYILSDVTFMSGHTSEYKEYIRSFIGKDIKLDRDKGEEGNIKHLAMEFKGVIGSEFYCYKAHIEICTKKGLYVSAPPSHFNTKGLRELGKHNLRVVGIIEEDPIVFEYLKGDLIRIKTKWGTPDDQSYLDENIINESQN